MTSWNREAIEEDLQQLDQWRNDAFEGHRRAALALAEQLAEHMDFLEPETLLDLADDRGCRPPVSPTDSLQEALRDRYEEGEAACREIAQRIVDTAIFGRDLHNVELHELVELAYSHSIEHGRMIGDWRTHGEIVPAARTRLRHCEVFVGTLDLDDADRFPDRTD